MSILLAFDIATEKTGYSVFQDEKYFQSGTITISGKYAKDRFFDMSQNIANIIRSLQPDEIVVEAAFIRKNPKCVEYLHKLQGIAEYFAKEVGAEFTSITTSTWRGLLKFPTNLRHTTSQTYKDLSIAYATEKVNHSVCDDNEADAICIGYAKILQNQKKI